MVNQQESTQNKILKYVEEKGQVRAEDLRRELNLSRVSIHKHLNRLVKSGTVSKAGKPPLVFYFCTKRVQTFLLENTSVSKKIVDFINLFYLYIAPTGEKVDGFPGFVKWVQKIKQENFLVSLAEEYVKKRKEANKFIKKNGLIDATDKIKSTFENVALNNVFYADFYSLPKFGKTKLGQLVLYSKQAQKLNLAKNITEIIFPLVENLIKEEKINAVGFVPPTVPRQIQFVKELERILNLGLPKIQIVKAYSGEITVAQKTLSNLEDRIQNARETIFIKDREVGYENILLIDDAVGSGSTLNETAKKFLKYPSVKKVIGFAIVGSFKGFDVIQAV